MDKKEIKNDYADLSLLDGIHAICKKFLPNFSANFTKPLDGFRFKGKIQSCGVPFSIEYIDKCCMRLDCYHPGFKHVILMAFLESVPTMYDASGETLVCNQIFIACNDSNTAILIKKYLNVPQVTRIVDFDELFPLRENSSKMYYHLAYKYVQSSECYYPIGAFIGW